jgi:hypothetical protein
MLRDQHEVTSFLPRGKSAGSVGNYQNFNAQLAEGPSRQNDLLGAIALIEMKSPL